MLNPQDLQRVSAEKAAAVLVLCNKFSSDPSKNILSSANVLREYQEKDMTLKSSYWTGNFLLISTKPPLLTLFLIFYAVHEKLALILLSLSLFNWITSINEIER